MNDRPAYDALGLTDPFGDPIDADVNGDLNRDGLFNKDDDAEWPNLLDPDYFWVGDGDWNNPANWSPQGMPLLYWDASLENDSTSNTLMRSLRRIRQSTASI